MLGLPNKYSVYSEVPTCAHSLCSSASAIYLINVNYDAKYMKGVSATCALFQTFTATTLISVLWGFAMHDVACWWIISELENEIQQVVPPTFRILTKRFFFFFCKWSGGMYQRWKASFEFLLMCKDVLAVPAVFWTIPLLFRLFSKH